MSLTFRVINCIATDNQDPLLFRHRRPQQSPSGAEQVALYIPFGHEAQIPQAQALPVW